MASYAEKLQRELKNIRLTTNKEQSRSSEKIKLSKEEDIRDRYECGGTPEYINGNIILSSLCPFNNIAPFDDDIMENIMDIKKQYPIIPGIPREDYIKQWLNIFYYNNNFKDTILKPLPYTKFDVEIPSLGIAKNPQFNCVRADMLYYLEQLYDMIYKKYQLSKIQITSAYRDPEYHAMTGCVDFDSHLIGCAVDIQCIGALKNDIERYAEAIGFGGIGIGKNFIHLDLNSKCKWYY